MRPLAHELGGFDSDGLIAERGPGDATSNDSDVLGHAGKDVLRLAEDSASAGPESARNRDRWCKLPRHVRSRVRPNVHLSRDHLWLAHQRPVAEAESNVALLDGRQWRSV